MKKRAVRPTPEEDERETVIHWKAGEQRKRYQRVTASPSLLQHSLWSTLVLKGLPMAEWMSSAESVIDDVANTVPPQTLDQLPLSLRQGVFGALLKSLTDAAVTRHETRLRSQLEAGDMRALREYVDAAALADRSPDDPPVKQERALRAALQEEWVIQGLLHALDKYPPAKERGAPAKLTHDERAQRGRDAKRKRDAKVKRSARRLQDAFDTAAPALARHARPARHRTDAQRALALRLMTDARRARAHTAGDWSRAVARFQRYLKREYGLLVRIPVKKR